MDENQIIKTIKTITNSEFIGDDCAYINDLDIVITQDSLVEDVHFKRKWISPFQLGYKSVVVNISDILASGAEPYSISVSLSLPQDLDNNFITEFYKGAKKALNGVKITGGDITGSSDKIFISIAAIGKTKNRNISSRKNAKNGYIIITKGNFGSSAKGLKDLINGNNDSAFIKTHLEPKLEYDFSNYISTNISVPYAMMDTSDGLADALFKIAEASHVSINVEYDCIPHLEGVLEDEILFGGEDYKLVAAVPEDFALKIPNCVKIGTITDFNGYYLKISDKEYKNYNELNTYNHFGENNG